MNRSEFLKKDSFNFSVLTQFFKKKKNKEKSSSVADLIEKLISRDYQQRIKLMVREDLNSEFDGETIDLVLKNFSTSLLLQEEKTNFAPKDHEVEIMPTPEPDFNLREETMDEVHKVHSRVPGWFHKPHQINSRILINFMELLADDKFVPLYKLESSCRSIKTFKNNYTQMKSYGERNHAKVFEESGGRVTLWEPVRIFVKEEYEKYNRRRGKR